jgi:hypothetical protein
MRMRRFFRLTNAFSKKFESHEAAAALPFMWYNVGRVPQTPRVTPTGAGIAHLGESGEFRGIAGGTVKNHMGVGVAIGVGMGAALGVALHNIPVWLAVGAAFGVVLGLEGQGARAC